VVVGGLSFLTDLMTFVVLLHVSLTVGAAFTISFIVGTLVNYGLSRVLAFTGGRYRRPREILRLFTVALAGLAFTATLVWTFMVLGLAPLVAKVIATPIALIWNYLGRRLFVFHPEMPSGIWQMSTRALSATRSIFLVSEPPANG